MHAPDGYLTAGTAIATGALSAGIVGLALKQSRDEVADRQLPLAGIAAAFIFAAQMVNFPVAAGTTGHLMGGALAAILLGPAMGAIVVTVVVVVQALAFADGGLTALGYNAFNMAIVTSYGGFAAFALLREVLPRTGTGVVAASGLAGLISVVLSALSFSIQWLFGASVPIPFDTVLGSMLGWHALIGIGEGLITALAVGAVLAARPDLVHGARDLDRAQVADRPPIGMRAFVLGGLLVALAVATVVSQFAGDAPDGLEFVAEETGFVDTAQDHALGGSIFADYATSGVADETLSLAIAGIAGTLVTLAVMGGIALALRRGDDGDGSGAGPGAGPAARAT